MGYSLEQLKVYMKCPQMFYYRYLLCFPSEKERSLPHHTSIELFNDYSLKNTYYDFFKQMQQGTIENIEYLKKRFGYYYSNNRRLKDTAFMSTVTYTYPALLEKRSIECIRNFYYEFSNEKRIPILVDRAFDINGLIVRIPVILEENGDFLYLISFYADHIYEKKLSTIDRVEIGVGDLDIIGGCIGFKKLMGFYPDRRYCYAMFSNMRNEITMTKKLEDKFFFITNFILESIEKKIFYPNFTSACERCAYKKRCKYDWSK